MSEERDIEKDAEEANQIADRILNAFLERGTHIDIACAAVAGALVDLYCEQPLALFLAVTHDMACIIESHQKGALVEDDEDEEED